MGSLGARIFDLWRGVFDALVRDNKVLPPVLALLALLLFSWVLAGAFMSGPDEEGTNSGEAELVQSRDPAAGADAPEVEDRDADSYAAYRNKDPFRQLLAPASESTSGDASGGTSGGTSGSASPGDTTDNTTDASAPSENPTTTSVPPGGTTPTEDDGGGQGSGAGDGGDRSRNDSDGDGLTNRQEASLGQDPRNPDTDEDGIQDGEDDSDLNGVEDGQQGGGGDAGGGAGSGGGGSGGGGSGGGGPGGGGGSDDLFDSGGTLPPR